MVAEVRALCAPGPGKTVEELADVTIPAVQWAGVSVPEQHIGGKTVPALDVPTRDVPATTAEAGCVVTYDAPAGCLLQQPPHDLRVAVVLDHEHGRTAFDDQ